MTQYIFAPQTLNQSVDWSEAAIWSGGVVPDSTDADVAAGPIYQGGTGQPYPYYLQIASGESFAVDSVSLSENYLNLYGKLTAAGDVTLGTDSALNLYGTLTAAGTVTSGTNSALNLSFGTLTAESLLNYGAGIEGSGLITVNTLVNGSTISGDGLTLDVGVLQMGGDLIASGGNLVVNGGSGNFFPQGTLTGGTWTGDGGSLVLNLGGVITTDAADIFLGSFYGTLPSDSSAIDSVSSGGDTLNLQDTLQTIAAGGTLTVADADFNSSQTLTVDGALYLAPGEYSAPGGSFSSASTTIAAGGQVMGVGTLSGPLVDNGLLTAGGLDNIDDAYNGFYPGVQGTLTLTGDVSGTGTLLIGPAGISDEDIREGNPDASVSPNTLELQGADSASVGFSPGAGTLVLADLQGFSGKISVAAPEFLSESSNGDVIGNTVQLNGISLAEVTGYAYTGTSSGGVLTISEGSVSQTLSFTGDLDTQSFALSAGPQLLSTTPPSLDIGITPLPFAPTIQVQPAASTVAAFAEIVNSTTVAVNGIAPAGTTLSFSEGTPQTSTVGSVTPGTTAGAYSTDLGALPLGASEIYAVASNVAGSTVSQTPLSLFVLPDPVNGITTAAVDSFELAPLFDAGYATQFVAGTTEIQLTDGTYSVGTETPDAYLQRLYEGLLDRPGDTAGLEANAAALQNDGMAAIAGAFLGSAEFTALHPAVAGLSNGNFVDFLYQNLLGRAPDAGGYTAFTNALQSGESRAAVTATIANSAEAQTYFEADTNGVWVPNATGSFITELYHTAFGRVPDLGGLAAFTGALQNGSTMLQVAQDIVASPEFAADHAGQTATALITSFYEDGLGRQPDAAGLQANLGALQSGASEAQILLGIATSPEAGTHLLPSI